VKRSLLTFCLLLFTAAGLWGSPRVQLRFFTDPSCATCHEVEEKLKNLVREYRFSLEKRSLFDEKAMQEIKALEEKYRVTIREIPVLEIVGYRLYQGKDILVSLKVFFEEGAVERENEEKSTDRSGFELTSLSVAAAGLIDGLNPCAFAAIIFLILYLLATRRKAVIPAVAGGFCLGVFVAYFAMGLGLRSLLSVLPSRELFRAGFHLILGLLLFGLALWSFYDAYRCMRKKSITLRLPEKWKKSINALIIRNSRSRFLFPAAFAAGLVISCIELACTGQIYLPVITLLIKEGKAGGLYYLTLYNLFFILPLVIVGVLAYYGVKEDLFRTFFTKSMVPVKIAMGLLFAALGLFLIT